MSKMTKHLSELLTKLTGQNVEVVDANAPDEDASPEARKAIEQLRAEEMNMRKQIARMASEFLQLVGTNCCTNPDHRRIPKDDSDMVAIQNAMACIHTQLFEAHKELVERLYVLLEASASGRKDVPKVLEDDIKGLHMELAATHSILEAHYDLSARPGKLKCLDHYVRIGAIIEAWADNKETGSETRRTH